MRNGKFAYPTLLLAVGCFAQEPAPYLAAIRGGVSVSRPGGERAKAGKNMALAAGDLVATGLHSRADVRLTPAVWLRLDANGELRVAQLEPDRYRLELERGVVTWYVDGLPPREIQIGTPSVGVRPSSPGVYRIAVNKARESEILARRGELEVFSPSGAQAVAAGQKMIARGDAGNPEFRIVSGLSVWGRMAAALENMAQAGVSSSGSSSDSDSGSSSSHSSSSDTGSKSSSAPAREQASQPVSKPDPPVARSDDSVSRSSPRTGSVR
jgi:hypothetical protein